MFASRKWRTQIEWTSRKMTNSNDWLHLTLGCARFFTLHFWLNSRSFKTTMFKSFFIETRKLLQRFFSATTTKKSISDVLMIQWIFSNVIEFNETLRMNHTFRILNQHTPCVIHSICFYIIFFFENLFQSYIKLIQSN